MTLSFETIIRYQCAGIPVYNKTYMTWNGHSGQHRIKFLMSLNDRDKTLHRQWIDDEYEVAFPSHLSSPDDVVHVSLDCEQNDCGLDLFVETFLEISPIFVRNWVEANFRGRPTQANQVFRSNDPISISSFSCK